MPRCGGFADSATELVQHLKLGGFALSAQRAKEGASLRSRSLCPGSVAGVDSATEVVGHFKFVVFALPTLCQQYCDQKFIYRG